MFELIAPTAGHTAWTRKVLSIFRGGADGSYPNAALVSDSGGNLYGITQAGGASGQGTVFKMVPPDPTHTGWRRSVIYSFGGGLDAAMPVALAIGADNNLYGTASSGGNVAFSTANPGAVFMLSPTSTSRTAWTEKLLYSFKTSGDGYQPHAGITFGDHGKLYGTTYFGGAYPSTALTITASGSIYGTTYYGGAHGYGTVFGPTASGAGVKEHVIYSFPGGIGGGNPATALVFGGANILYGTAYSGGADSFGTLFKVTTPPAGPGTCTTLASFGTASAVSALPNGNLVLKAGIIYGTTSSGNGKAAGGTIYEYSPGGGPV